MRTLRRLYLLLLLLTIGLNVYLYNYPLFWGCRFPAIDDLSSGARIWRQQPIAAPFRLLAFGDPQLEGSSSIRPSTAFSYKLEQLRVNLAAAPSVTDKLGSFSQAIRDLVWNALPTTFAAIRKRLDLLGNDYYLAHIYRTVHRSVQPTHVAVLGDLLGSQWIDDEEFARRADRFWQRVFRYGQPVEPSITDQPTLEILGHDPSWSRRVINVAGNHDIGYAGDLTAERLRRYEAAFGRANWEIVFQVPAKQYDNSNSSNAGNSRSSDAQAFLRLIVLNSMNLDTPVKDADLQTATYTFLNDVITSSQPVEDPRVGTVLLTHIPLHKDEGVCVDGPFFAFRDQEDSNGGIKEQNHLSYGASLNILEGLYGMSSNEQAPGGGLGRQGIILTGHDHEGCDVYHHLPRNLDDNPASAERRWNASRWSDAQNMLAAQAMDPNTAIPGIREVTLRSMMGEYGGWAYLISAWYENDTEVDDGNVAGEWRFEVARCAIGVQHWWWAGQVLILISAAATAVLILWPAPSSFASSATRKTSAPRRTPSSTKSPGRPRHSTSKQITSPSETALRRVTRAQSAEMESEISNETVRKRVHIK